MFFFKKKTKKNTIQFFSIGSVLSSKLFKNGKTN